MTVDLTRPLDLPVLFQGGMGVAVSDWRLAGAVARVGQLGVVAGTALDVVHARRLADGDPGGHLRLAYAHFPVPAMADSVLNRWFRPAGRPTDVRYRNVPMFTEVPSAELRALTIMANFAEVWLAKDGHDGQVGINYLEKVQLPTPYAVWGAMLAGVDAVLMGAGIPAGIPALLNALADGDPVTYRHTVTGAAADDDFSLRFDPTEVMGSPAPRLARPPFLAIVSSHTLAMFLAKDPATRPDGFVVEGASAGGHNAPPRGPRQLDELGQPIYGQRDQVDLTRLAGTGLPFWLAGGYADPDQLVAALAAGAAGVQVGTAFALCAESGIAPELKRSMVAAALAGDATVFTDPDASPSGYPFKVVRLPGTIGDPSVSATRERVCDLGFLREAFKQDDGTVGYRCPSEPVDAYVRKGGAIEDTVGRLCLCNGLLATVQLGQVRVGKVEAPLVTAGDDLEKVVQVFAGDSGSWTAADVVHHVMSTHGS
ncbi:MAG TPA: nitronate monooxygenase [Ilumatobacteraceae bacterium]|nr:nitronate monooxygenase [Ilumatobacteraceae bacterium]HRB04033.1 nitronate monooxygenase [Ilumatobacteraceae bacterium]